MKWNNPQLEYYKPSSNAWKAVCVAFLAVCASLYGVFVALVDSDLQIKVQGAYSVSVESGAGAQDITVHQHIQQKVGL